jgi:hypothetical protein
VQSCLHVSYGKQKSIRRHKSCYCFDILRYGSRSAVVFGGGKQNKTEKDTRNKLTKINDDIGYYDSYKRKKKRKEKKTIQQMNESIGKLLDYTFVVVATTTTTKQQQQ